MKNLFKSLALLACLLFSTVAFAGQCCTGDPEIGSPTVADDGSWKPEDWSGSGLIYDGFNADKFESSVIYWFTHDSAGNQLYLIGVETDRREDFGARYDLYVPRGVGLDVTTSVEDGEVVGTAFIRKFKLETSQDVFEEWMEYRWYFNFLGPDFCDGFSPVPHWCNGEYRLVRALPN